MSDTYEDAFCHLHLHADQVGYSEVLLDIKQVMDIIRQLRLKGNVDRKWDINLAEGKVAEKLTLMILDGRITAEVKQDMKYDLRGNLAIETEDRKKKSGLNVTEAEYWIHWIGDILDNAIIIKVSRLKSIIKNKNVVAGGDNDAARMVLVKPIELIKAPLMHLETNQIESKPWLFGER